MPTKTENTLNRAIRRLEERRAEKVRDQLTAYCQNADREDLEAVGATEAAADLQPNQLIGWPAASTLPDETLEALFLRDDYGRMWEVMDGETTKYYENDSGAIAMLDEVLALLREEADNA